MAIHLEEATEMNLHLQRSVSATESVETTEIVSLLSFQGGTRESLELDSKDLLYIESDGNYIRVNYQKGGRTMQCLLRMTMKQAEEVTGGSPLVAKCHRAFLVNLRKVVKVSGNSQGYRLLLEGCPEEIPVSRAYSKQVKELMETIVRANNRWSQKDAVRHIGRAACHISGLSVPNIFFLEPTFMFAGENVSKQTTMKRFYVTVIGSLMLLPVSLVAQNVTTDTIFFTTLGDSILLDEVVVKAHKTPRANSRWSDLRPGRSGNGRRS